MSRYRTSDRERAASVVGVAVVHAVVGLVLLSGLAPRLQRSSERGLNVFDVIVPPPLRVVVQHSRSSDARTLRDAASAANLRAVPKPVVLPVAIVPPPVPTIVAPPVGSNGIATFAGAAPSQGPGSGAGGAGNGLGAEGMGTGAGASRARLIRGAIVNRDYPADARRANLVGSVTVRFTVAPDGRTRGCAVTRSSGVASLDVTTCRLIERRFRYTPALDAAGQAVAEERGWRQTWWLEGQPRLPTE